MFVWTMPSVTTKLPSVHWPDNGASQPYILVNQFFLCTLGSLICFIQKQLELFIVIYYLFLGVMYMCMCVYCVVTQSSVSPSVVDPIDWQSVNEKRLELLTTVCRNSSLWNLTHTTVGKFVLDRIFVCDKHKILFCQTPKVGNTQWKKVLIVLNGEKCLQVK